MAQQQWTVSDNPAPPPPPEAKEKWVVSNTPDHPEEAKSADWRDKLISKIADPNINPDSALGKLEDRRSAKDLGLKDDATADEIAEAKRQKPIREGKAGHFLSSAGVGAANLLLHPYDSAVAYGKQLKDAATVLDPINVRSIGGEVRSASERQGRAREQAEEVRKDPVGAAGQLAGQIAAGEVVGEVAGKAKLLPERARTAVQRAVGASKEKVAAEAAKTAQQATTELDRVKAQNKAATEKTLERRGRVDAINKKQEEMHARRVGETAEENAKRVTKSKERLEQLQKDHQAEVKAVEEENQKRLQSAEEKAKAAKDAHIAAVKEVKEHNEYVRKMNARRGALESGIKQAGERYGTEIKDLEKSVRGQAGEKYTDLRATLKDQGIRPTDPLRLGRKFLSEVDPENAEIHAGGQGDEPLTFSEFVDAADSKIQGTEVEPPLFKELRKRLMNNDLLSYKDLQGYASEISRTMRAGGLPGDVYQAHKMLQEGVSAMMQQMAENADAEVKEGNPEASPNTAAKMLDARNFYRKFMEDFHEPSGPSGSGSPLAQALNAKDSAKVLSPFTGDAGDRGIEVVARHDPDLAKRINSVRKLQEEYDAPAVPVRTKPLRSEVERVGKSEKEKPLPERKPNAPTPELKPTPEPLAEQPAPELKPEPIPKPKREYTEPEAHEAIPDLVVDPEQIRKDLIAKTAANWSDISRYEGRRLAGSAIGGVISMLTHGNPFAGATVGYLAARGMQKMAAAALNSPRIVEWLAKPSPEDIKIINKIPGIDRTNIKKGLTRIAVEAAKSGKPIKLAPAVGAFIGADNMRLVKMAEGATKNSEDGDGAN